MMESLGFLKSLILCDTDNGKIPIILRIMGHYKDRKCADHTKQCSVHILRTFI